MTSVSIGLVTEGKSDFAIFEWCLGAALHGAGIESRFRRLSPVLDSTSGTYTEGGWRKVYQWCLRNNLLERRRFFSGGLFAGSEDDLDVIFVHVDGDLHIHFAQNHPGEDICQVAVTDNNFNPLGHLEFCIAVLDSWLFRGVEVGERDACIATPTVMASEAWLIGGLGYHPTPESVADPKSAFARLWLLNTGRAVPPNIRKLKRHATEVERAVASSPPDLRFVMNDSALKLAIAAAQAHSKA